MCKKYKEQRLGSKKLFKKTKYKAPKVWKVLKDTKHWVVKPGIQKQCIALAVPILQNKSQ